MSFGFGSNNNNNSNTGGFGGFGGSNTGGGFGSNNASTGGSLFGGNTATSGGFGGSGGFGSNTNTGSPFGAKPAFGAPTTTTTGGGLFGSNTSTSGGFGGGGGGGGFGNTSNTGGFGSNTGGGLFGQNKPATGGFGSNAGTNSLFGGSNTTGGFAASNTTTSNPFNPNTSSAFGGSNTGGGFGFGGSSNAAANSNNNNNGTANSPFSAFSEKEPNTNQTSLYQSITFQQPYLNKSFEELRTEDYAQGRRFGNSNGQAGGFGQSTGFGSFGTANASTGGSLFGGNTATSGNTGFGANNNTNTNTLGGFGGSNTSGGLFGNKNPSGSLFGQQSSATNTNGFGATSGTAGGLFGSSNNNNNTSAFGGAGNTSGGLFGSNNQQQSQSGLGGFGNTNTSGGFGGNSNTGSSLFGNTNNANAGASLFGQNNQQPQQQQNNGFGSNTANAGASLFGNANKPAGASLFGSNANQNTGGGLFGAPQTQQSNSPFGQSNNSGGNSLFGNLNQNQNKPAGTGLFGSSTNPGGGAFGSTNNQNTGSSLFGGNNTNNSGSLFGNLNKPATTSLFGNNPSTTNTNNGLSLFGNQQNQQGNGGSSLFGGLNQNNQNQQNSNSLFGGSLGQSQPAQNQLHASLTGAPYGNEQLFSSLAAPSPPVGPLATPLSGARPAPRKTPSLLASARINTPVYSPRGGSFGRTGGYGFSYSTYGTPGSAYTSGSLTPGASSLLRPTGSLGSALTSRLSKSFSTSNLRGDSTPNEGRSLLRPGAFSPEGTPGRYSNTNVRRLNIDRSLRTDLFGPEPKAIEAAKEADGPELRKRVSFERPQDKDVTPSASASNALVRTEDREEDESPGLIRAGPNKSQSRGQGQEMEQINGALTTVPEDSEAPRPSSAPPSKAPAEQGRKNEIGEYLTKPALKDLKNMSRQQLKNVGSFVVGREGVGRIEFGSVDLTNTPLEDICGSIVQLNPRSATVYQDDQDKPAMGKALNVPSTIYLDNSWPRSHGGRKPVNAKSGKDYEKHIARLKRVAGTHFVSYSPDTGVWCFKVDHFTTYGLDDDDESVVLDDSQMLDTTNDPSDAPETPNGAEDVTMQSLDTGTGELEDTFQLQLDRRSQLSLPGGFGTEEVMDDFMSPRVAAEVEDEHMMSGGLGVDQLDDPFLSGGAVQPPSPGSIERYHSSFMEDEPQAEEEDEDQEMPGSFVEEPKIPRSILKPSHALSVLGSPEKLATQSWEEQLQQTLSPMKRDRQALKDAQHGFPRNSEDDVVESPFKRGILGRSALAESYLAQKSAKKGNGKSAKAIASTDLGKSQAFNTAVDLMESMYAPQKTGQRSAAGAKGFEFPYAKRPRLSTSNEMTDEDMAWHASVKPSFTTSQTLVYSVPSSWPQPSGDLSPNMLPVVGEHKDVRFATFTPAADIDARMLRIQKEAAAIDISTGFPAAHAPDDILFASLADNVDETIAIGSHEQAIWRLCSILFDPLEVACASYLKGVPEAQVEQYESRMRMDALSAFWATLVSSSVQDGLKRARTAEEKALIHLSQNDIVSACETLVEAKDFKLAVLVSQLPGTEQSRHMMKKQIEVWCNRNDWSEMSGPVRALYSILAGELCTVQGKTGAAENRVAELNIAEAFGLSWQQSFGLRLNFGGHATVEEAIHSYLEDRSSGKEVVSPTSEMQSESEINDIFIEIFRTYAGHPDSSKLFDPRTVSGNALNWRLSWQLASLLQAQGHCKLPKTDLDKITYNFAVQLEAAARIVDATWALLHIQDSKARQRAIISLLERHGDKIAGPSEGERGTFDYLAHDNQIPSALIWRAKALYAKSGLHDNGLQAEWLLRAGDTDAAHEVLCTEVGPKAVIEQDYALLSNLLQHFDGRRVNGWEQGGQVYADYLKLSRRQPGRRQLAEEEAAMGRLRRGLAGMEEDGVNKTLEEKVAIIEMGKVLEDEGADGHDQAMSGMEQMGSARGMEADMLNRYRQAMLA